MHAYDRCGKRVLDVALSLGASVVAVPFVAVACAAIAIESPGRPLLRQERAGRYGMPFGMWKLRTMRADAESRSTRYLSSDQLRAWRKERKLDGDPRVTCVGRFLRATSLDEVPQFANVLAGHMSVVGPRPVTYEELANFTEDDRAEVLSVRPGITGWWQTVGHATATWGNGRRQAMELFYVRNRSLSLDARILLRTAGVVFGLRNG